jgi:hypothetical protein
MNITSTRLEQVMRFSTKGSLRDGTIENGCLGLDTHLEMEADESPERIRELLRMGEKSCYTMQALTAPVPVRTFAKLNGVSLQLDSRDA